MNISSYSPNRTLNQSLNKSTILEQSLILNRKRHKLKESLIWFSINFLILAIIIYDLTYKVQCMMYMSYYHYLEYSLTIVFTLNVVFYLARICRLYFSTYEPITVTVQQKKLLGVKDSDPNYTIISPSKTPPRSANMGTPLTQNTPLNMTALSWRSNASPGQQATPLNMTALSWRSNLSQQDNLSMNYSMSSPSWSYHKGTPNSSNIMMNAESVEAQNTKYINEQSALENIEDEDEEQEKDDEEKITLLSNRAPNSQNNLLSAFWSHPVTQKAKDISTILKMSQYQLSSQSPSEMLSGSPSNKQEDKSANSVPCLEVWTRINVDTVALTQWNENLRMWLSQTILERLVKEFDVINESLDKHNMSDCKIGMVGLDRLRKTALMTQISHFIPSLSAIIQFLELHPNQEYLVKRIRELARGGCMSEFKWNGGGHYNGKDWDQSLPTDCAVVMHLLACYLDTQMMPSPNMPDAKPFTGQYYVKVGEKTPVLTPRSVFIQEVTVKPPHYRVVVGEKIYEMVKGYNNLFHSILFFIYNVNKLEQGMLGRVNLGRAGLNMLWIVGENE
ncbi:transmembrane protein 209 [Anthonomus grandis grandis]|uniref:transmembrane protein 209 n=1 Tax=Anthonomus grandis grandis TaxID=2921223 RepID=UPI0021657F13|nr:transmembrane protein 209 [Anthonomus grandis grandis]